MKNFGLSSLLVAVVLVLLLITVVVMAYVMYALANAETYDVDANKKVVKEGLEAQKFWTNNKYLLITPTVCNVLGMVLLGLMYVVT